MIRQVLERYWSDPTKSAVRIQEQRQLAFRASEPFAEYEIYVTLMAWYLANGAYRTEVSAQTRGDDRRVDWNRTLARSIAIHSAQSSFYPEPIQFERRAALNEISLLQLSVLKHLREKYSLDGQVVALYELGSSAPLAEEVLFGNAAIYAARIRQELSKVYRSDKIHMLRNLELFFREAEGYDGPRATRLFGTTAFHVVWEHACSVAAGNAFASLSANLAQPRWSFKYPERMTLEGGKQRPDVLAEHAGRYLLILDAKYYYPLPNSICGWEDLVKQFFYERSYRQRSRQELINGLLFPEPAVDSVRLAGEVRLARGGKTVADFPALLVFQVNPTRLFQRYANSSIEFELLGELVAALTTPQAPRSLAEAP